MSKSNSSSATLFFVIVHPNESNRNKKAINIYETINCKVDNTSNMNRPMPLDEYTV